MELRTMKSYIRATLSIVIVLAMTSACIPIDTNEEEMQSLGPKVVELTKMVEVAVRYDGVTLENGEQALLREATKHDPEVYQWFNERYAPRVDIKDRHAVILVCTKDGKQGLYEDTACKTGPDVQLWATQLPCEFTLTEADVTEVCKLPSH